MKLFKYICTWFSVTAWLDWLDDIPEIEYPYSYSEEEWEKYFQDKYSRETDEEPNDQDKD